MEPEQGGSDGRWLLNHFRASVSGLIAKGRDGALPRRLRMTLRYAVLATALVLGAVSCGGDTENEGTGTGTTPDAGESQSTVAVELAPFSVSADPNSVPSGTVTFDIKSETSPGQSGHALTVLRTDIPPDELPMGPVGEAITSGEGIEVMYTEAVIGPDHTAEVELEPGPYALICNVANHYERGMRTGFEVT
jgi:uncharacterized cupredoxin-like copper-binding protein